MAEAMTKQQTVTKEALVEGLNEDLSYEYQAVLMYNSYAAMASGIHRPLLKSFFEQEISEELEHAQFLADKVTALGGTPTKQPKDFQLAKTPEKMLQQVLQAESDTINRYVERRQQAEKLNEYGLVADLDGVISDETHHKEETEKLLRGIVTE